MRAAKQGVTLEEMSEATGSKELVVTLVWEDKKRVGLTVYVHRGKWLVRVCSCHCERRCFVIAMSTARLHTTAHFTPQICVFPAKARAAPDRI